MVSEKMIKLFFLFFLLGCNSQLMKLASEFDASLVFFNQAQKDLRAINSDCDFDRDCFETEALYHIIDKLCPSYQDYNFISEKECNRAGDQIMDLVLGKIEPSIPIRNTNQDRHNDRIYELEKEKIDVLKNLLREDQRRDWRLKQSQTPMIPFPHGRSDVLDDIGNPVEGLTLAQMISRDKEGKKRAERIAKRKDRCSEDFSSCKSDCPDGPYRERRRCVNSCRDEDRSCAIRAESAQ